VECTAIQLYDYLQTTDRENPRESKGFLRLIGAEREKAK